MLEGIGTGLVIAVGWVALLLLVASPWAQDRVRDGVLSTVGSLIGSVAVLLAGTRAGDLADVHGWWVGYGSVLGAAAVVLGVCGVTLRRLPLLRAWQLYGIPVGRVPPPKSRRRPKSRRAVRSQRV